MMTLRFIKRARYRAAQENVRQLAFKPLSRFEMIIEWHASLNKNPRIQRLGFKAENDFLLATQSALRFVALLNSVYSNTHVKNPQFCRLIAVYEEKAFKSYEAEPLYNPEIQRKEMAKKIAGVKAQSATEKPIKTAKKGVRVQ